jgi:hypothetical protein
MSIPLLCDDLQLVEKLTLSSLSAQPGFNVLVKIMNAACDRATKDVIKLNPAEKGYQQQLVTLQSRARFMNEFCQQVLDSIDWQVKDGEAKQAIKRELEGS